MSLSTPTQHTSGTERTLAVFYAPSTQLRPQLEKQLTLAGFLVRAQADAVDEELEEAGLDKLGEGEEVQHWAVVLERKDAVRELKQLKGEGTAALNKNALSSLFPHLKMHCSPSTSAANMSISTLFPRLASSPSPAPASVSSTAGNTSSVDSPLATAKPFALSNLAHPAPLVLNTNAREKQLSPSIERALRDLELKEEERRIRKISGGSGSSRLSALSATQAEELSDEDEGEEQQGDQRVFSARSRDTTLEFDVHADNATEGEDEDDTLQQPEQDLEEGEEQEVLSPVESDSPSIASAPHLTRQTSTVSSTASVTSKSPSSYFRARPVPSSVVSPPLNQPRMTKAAALRLGIPYESAAMRRQSSANSMTTATTTSSVEARVVPTPRSLAAPSIAPRPTKSSALRGGTAGAVPAAPTRRRETIGTAERAALDKQRRASLAGAMGSEISAPKPRVEVRMSKAAMLRQGMEIPPTPAAMRRQASESSIRSASVASDNESQASSSARIITRRQSISGPIKSSAQPKIVPRQTKASALRAGVDSPIMTRGKSASALEDLHEEGEAPPMARAKTTTSFEGIPGHKRRESIQVASTSQPKIAPRMSRASMLRLGMEVESPQLKRQSSTAADCDGVPGHPRRRESLSTLPSLSKPPMITPRLNRSTLLRQGSSNSTSASSISPTLHRRAQSSLGLAPPPATRSRPSSALSSISNLTLPTNATAGSRIRTAHSSTDSTSTPPTPVASAPTPIKTARAPAITPRSNKSAMLRAAKKEADVAVATAAAAARSSAAPKRRVLPGGPPSLVKAKGRPSTALGLTREGGAKSSKGSEENVGL